MFMLDDEAFRARLRAVVVRSGRSMRALSTAMGRDQGYVGALLDPSRPSRARPTPADLLAASDATGIPFVELLEQLWAIEPARLARELDELGVTATAVAPGDLRPADRRIVADFAAFLASRRGGSR
jgi:hypothetical protein